MTPNSPIQTTVHEHAKLLKDNTPSPITEDTMRSVGEMNIFSGRFALRTVVVFESDSRVHGIYNKQIMGQVSQIEY